MIDLQPGFGWDKTLILANDWLEVVVTLEVGPRIISFRQPGGDNILFTRAAELGGQAETQFRLRGGHRLWVAPESNATYYPDNHPVAMQTLADQVVRLSAPPEQGRGLQKSLTLELEGDTLSIAHEIHALSNQAEPLAVWALTMLQPGGIAEVKQPDWRPHPGQTNAPDEADYLPNRTIALWPYTRLNDPRLDWSDPIRISQTQAPPLKIGFLFREQRVHYQWMGMKFSKSVSFDATGQYPDGQSNLEIYTDEAFLELETLSPLQLLQAGDTIVHTEHWQLARS